MKVGRVERHTISKSHPMWNVCDELCFESKDLYNYANYFMRQSFIDKQGIIKYNDLTMKLKHSDPFKKIGSNSGQHTLKMLCRNWKSFMELLKMYNKNPNSLLGRPRLPKYKDKNGRYVCVLTNLQTQIKDGYLYFAFKRMKQFNNTIKTNITTKHLSTRIVPNGSNYILELVYEIEVPETKEDSNRICAIDLGLNNFITMSNNIGVKPIIINGKGIKSYNHYWNKKISNLRSIAKTQNKLDWTKQMQQLTEKRSRKLDYFLHCSSKCVIDYCINNNIDTIVIGLNKEWKQNSKMNNVVNQNFIQIPYFSLINKIKYKAENIGVKVIETEESYTSGTSFLDNELPCKENHNKSRRVKRGLFKSNNGTLINADLNASYQIMKKVFPNVFANGVEGVDLHPLMVNIPL